ncbi:Uu.00g141620.m01.CDS01 [Anthostomella pinea]|uniref:Uu.00g141620.m01.CDS01 n=1 Tax=Anthostomella pinea TaxID=933095 RepID=A0AAI8YJ36_9PEZI|nr:Uu.00g141620.m01.CDS01 [Anthostomella pinea]
MLQLLLTPANFPNLTNADFISSFIFYPEHHDANVQARLFSRGEPAVYNLDDPEDVRLLAELTRRDPSGLGGIRAARYPSLFRLADNEANGNMTWPVFQRLLSRIWLVMQLHWSPVTFTTVGLSNEWGPETVAWRRMMGARIPTFRRVRVVCLGESGPGGVSARNP